MKKLEIMKNLNRTVHKAGFRIKKHSPKILIVAGVVGAVTTAVYAAARATFLFLRMLFDVRIAVIDKPPSTIDGP